jgi:formylglycine-generating enzyme required for sulfatase activity/serine/threonine protein kinase
MPGARPDRLSPAGEAFAEYLELEESGTAPDFDAFCSARPELAPKLRRLHGRWVGLSGALAGVGAEKSVWVQSSSSPVAGLDPRISLAEPDPSAPAASVAGTSGDAPGRYELGAELARGGCGAILEAWDRDLRRRVAMKVLLGRDAQGRPILGGRAEPRAISRFLEEAQVTGQLEHPGIVPVHELGLDAHGQVYFTMALVRGRDFEQIIRLVHARQDGWSVPRALGVLQRICETMAYAHERGVVHRDLKPSNVMVGRYGEAYVMDWGFARVLGRRADADAAELSTSRREFAQGAPSDPLTTKDGDVLGTPAYMPPEQASGRIEDVDRRSDVYAAGAMLYHLLAGVPPFQGRGANPGARSTAREVLDAVMRGPPRPVHELARGVPPELEAICDKAMARARDSRYGDMREMADDLRAYLEVRVVRAWRSGAAAELSKWIRRNRGLALASAAAVAALVVGLAASLTLFATAEEERARVLRLADHRRLRELEQRADDLWPALPERRADYDAWLAEARSLLERLETEHRPTLADLERRAGGSTEDLWHEESLADLVRQLEAFAGALVPDVEARLEWASEVEERTTTGAEVAPLWEAATASIRDPRSSPRYGGLALEPQVGLVPIGRDPASGLWEFAHPQSGAVPSRDPDSGTLAIGAETGLVFVLVPGGTFRMGGPGEDEGPVHEVALEPFFLSKCEMTAGQWLRSAGWNPSAHLGERADLVYTLRHPVEQVSWVECDRVLRRMGLALPTEARWEYAARAGTTSAWSAGDAREALVGCANLADQAAARIGADWSEIADWPELDDGFPVAAPVGSLRPNPFGLHDVHGNVWEWCLDHYGSYALPVRAGAGRRPGPLAPGGLALERVNRGGGFYDTARSARSAARMFQRSDRAYDDLGVRPAREVD